MENALGSFFYYLCNWKSKYNASPPFIGLGLIFMNGVELDIRSVSEIFDCIAFCSLSSFTQN